jgi:5'-deoxynucleotidase YfbR-like HD superfamily hydrolase
MLKADQILAMQDVRRWHTRCVRRDQTVAEHSHAVALLALSLAPLDIPDSYRFQILLAGLTHDAHETQFGDTPYPAKRELAELGIDIDGVCRRAFWEASGTRDPWTWCSRMVCELVDLADIIEAALWAEKHAPDLARTVRAQALEAIRRVTFSPYVTTRALEILGEVTK